MDRQGLVLTSLSVDKGAIYSPVQVQKMFFLIDRNIPKLVEGPHFDFKPYDYGPFDKEVYSVLGELSALGQVKRIQDNSWFSYRLTMDGQKAGEALFEDLPETARKYIQEVSDFVRSLSFTQLVSAIYQAYPDMRENSVFQV